MRFNVSDGGRKTEETRSLRSEVTAEVDSQQSDMETFNVFIHSG